MSTTEKKRWKDALTPKYGPHRHCVICGKAVPPEEDFCSQACRDKYSTTEKSKNKKNNIQLILIFGVFIAFMIFMQFAR
jgi:predicted nucleic acid-binding Zn ribbon protein